MQDQLFERKALSDYTALYPGKSFMELTEKRDQTKSIVGTMRTITEEPMYVEEAVNGRDYSEVVASIASRLETKVNKRAWRFGGLVTGYKAPEEVGK